MKSHGINICRHFHATDWANVIELGIECKWNDQFNLIHKMMLILAHSLLLIAHVQRAKFSFYVWLERYSNVKPFLMLSQPIPCVVCFCLVFLFCRHQILCFTFDHAAFASGFYFYILSIVLDVSNIVCKINLSWYVLVAGLGTFFILFIPS